MCGVIVCGPGRIHSNDVLLPGERWGNRRVLFAAHLQELLIPMAPESDRGDGDVEPVVVHLLNPRSKPAEPNSAAGDLESAAFEHSRSVLGCVDLRPFESTLMIHVRTHARPRNVLRQCAGYTTSSVLGATNAQFGSCITTRCSHESVQKKPLFVG